MTTLQDYFDAVRVLLARGILADRANGEKRVHDAVRVNGTAPVRDNYVVLVDESPVLRDDRYLVGGRVDARARHRFDVRSVSVNAAGRRQFQQAVRDNLIGAVPVVEGRVCTAISLVPAVEEGRPAHDASANLFHVTESFEFWSRRA